MSALFKGVTYFFGVNNPVKEENTLAKEAFYLTKKRIVKHYAAWLFPLLLSISGLAATLYIVVSNYDRVLAAPGDTLTVWACFLMFLASFILFPFAVGAASDHLRSPKYFKKVLTLKSHCSVYRIEFSCSYMIMEDADGCRVVLNPSYVERSLLMDVETDAGVREILIKHFANVKKSGDWPESAASLLNELKFLDYHRQCQAKYEAEQHYPKFH